MNPPYETSAGELELQAFRYAAGEMSASEATDFEELLAVDQSVREALAAAVQLTDAVASLEPVISPLPAGTAKPRRRKWRERVRWMAIGATAACLTIVAGWQFSQDAGDVLVASAQQMKDANQMVALWGDPSLLGRVVGDEANDLQSADQPEAEEADALFRSLDSTAEIHVPNWMLAAVSLAEQQREQQREENE